MVPGLGVGPGFIEYCFNDYGMGVTQHGQITVQVEGLFAGGYYFCAAELKCRILFYIEVVFALHMCVPLLIVHVQAVGLDYDLGAGFGNIIWIEIKTAREFKELALGLRKPKMADKKQDLRMKGVKNILFCACGK